ncbi:MAG: hypothetical protein GY861_09925 [bacterium]|nr:hypothetical protein [bacterium]
MKKAMGNVSEMLVASIAAVLIAVVLTVFVNDVADASNRIHEREICSQSINEHIIAKNFGYSDAKINCPTYYHTIKKKDEERVMKELAEDMYMCWDDFKRGKESMFKDDGVFCVVYSVIEFEDEDLFIAGEDLGYYLENTLVPHPPGSEYEGETYAMALGNFGSNRSEDVLSEDEILQVEDQSITKDENALDIHGDRQYATIFVYARGNDVLEQLVGNYIKSPGGGVSLAVAGGSLGSTAIISAKRYKKASAMQFPVMGSSGTAFSKTQAASMSMFSVKNTVKKFVKPVAAVTAIAGAAGVVDSAMNTDFSSEWFAAFAFQEYDEKELKTMGCEYIPIKQHEDDE